MRQIILLTLILVLGVASANADRLLKINGLTAVEELDDAAQGNASIDVQQGLCGTGDSATDEPFKDTLLRIAIHNELPYSVNFTRVSFVIPRASLTGRTVRTRRFALARTGEVPSNKDEDTNLYALFMDALGTGKAFAGESSALSSTYYGFKNVTVKLFGRTAAGRAIILTARTALSFDNIDECNS